jgi:hypothetical protein
MALRFDQTEFTVARQISADGVKRYLVWIRRGEATICHLYAASSAEDAKRQAREELQWVDAMLGGI